MKLQIYVLFISVILPNVFTDTTVGLRHVLDQEEHEKLKKFVDKIVNSTVEDLAMPPILQPSTSPTKFLQEEKPLYLPTEAKQIYKKTRKIV